MKLFFALQFFALFCCHDHNGVEREYNSKKLRKVKKELWKSIFVKWCTHLPFSLSHSYTKTLSHIHRHTHTHVARSFCLKWVLTNNYVKTKMWILTYSCNFQFFQLKKLYFFIFPILFYLPHNFLTFFHLIKKSSSLFFRC